MIIHIYPPVKMEPTEGSETSAFNIQTPGKYQEENIPYLQHGESLKTTIIHECSLLLLRNIQPTSSLVPETEF
jgi:hypothetical protein